MSKFENLSHIIANHEVFWAKLGSHCTASECPELASFLHEVWDPWYTRWLHYEGIARNGGRLISPKGREAGIDSLVLEAAQGLSGIRRDAVHHYGLTVPDIGSSGPDTYSGAVSLIGAFGDSSLADSMRNQMLAQARAKAASQGRSRGRQNMGRGAGGASDHRSNPGGYDPRASARTPMERRGEIPDIVKQLRAAEGRKASERDDRDDDDQDDGQEDVASGWWSDAVHFVKKHTSDIKDAATYAGGAIGGKLGEQIAGAAVDAALGDPVAAKKIAAAIDHPDPKVAATAVAVVAATKQVIEAKQVQVQVQPHKADPALSLMASWG